MRYTEVIDRLYVGSCPLVPKDIKELKKMGITAVMNLQTDADMLYWRIDWDKMTRTYEKSDIKVYRYPIRDEKLEEGISLLDSILAEEHKVYLHCNAGLNRSPTMAVGYLVKKMRISRHDAARLIMSRYYCEPYLDIIRL
ncbi:MAG TPA: dual specificity protein phosphatase family protein [Thermodesulfovibrionia bacterium]|nr:dual specificity protein phosphatase family protein [Thermodesulfovibrionia bacterium]